MTQLANFFYMGGYAWYIWIAYGTVISVLFLQWLIPWRRFKRTRHE